MNETDGPLKRLVKTSTVDFAEWILGAKVDRVESANIELQADPAPIFSDLIFWVTLAERDTNGEPIRILLHFEFQGESSRKPMRFRMLDYIVRIADSERDFRIHSVVFYIGDGVGAKDIGAHELKGIGGRVTLAWRYDVVRLWQIDPEHLLELKRPGLLPLIGQTKIENPDELIPRVYAEIKSVPNEETQHKLLTELLALLQDKEVVEMVESLIEQDEWALDTPYLRRWRTEIQEAQSKAEEAESKAEEAESRAKEAESIAEEAQSKAEEARSQAEKYRILVAQNHQKELEHRQEVRRQDILSQVAIRYDPSMREGLRLQKCLSAIADDEAFRGIFEAIVQVQDFDQFYTIVEEVAPSESVVNAI